ncbi:hypothetical protein [Deinococcus arenicola]|uniref:Apea-like HEPN domain-containing protein n=1 Tax=Deinococcus arenicola TaxID=2994950 RepID=A0ABU4DLN6_9DEIO|nr:hypothetical protein [Deinococcus sp. ZS9-10]MDV6373336.1 hypothetical protein [Deinococcus sp. ZS9-10]
MSWTQMDMSLAEYADDLKGIGVPDEFLHRIATSVRHEILSLDADILKAKFSARYPDAASVYDQIIYNWTFSGSHQDEIDSDVAVNQTAVLAANYLYFIYAQDTYLQAIANVSPKRGPSHPIAKFLTTGEVWGFRNAFAHGEWCYVGEKNSMDIQYIHRVKGIEEFRLISPRKLHLWHLLSKTLLGLWSARMADLRQPIQNASQVSQ